MSNSRQSSQFCAILICVYLFDVLITSLQFKVHDDSQYNIIDIRYPIFWISNFYKLNHFEQKRTVISNFCKLNHFEQKQNFLRHIMHHSETGNYILHDNCPQIYLLRWLTSSFIITISGEILFYVFQCMSLVHNHCMKHLIIRGRK